MSETQGGIGWAMAGQIHDRPPDGSARLMVEVAYGPELARLRECERKLRSLLGRTDVRERVLGVDFTRAMNAEELDVEISAADNELADLRRDRERLKTLVKLVKAVRVNDGETFCCPVDGRDWWDVEYHVMAEIDAAMEEK